MVLGRRGGEAAASAYAQIGKSGADKADIFMKVKKIQLGLEPGRKGHVIRIHPGNEHGFAQSQATVQGGPETLIGLVDNLEPGVIQPVEVFLGTIGGTVINYQECEVSKRLVEDRVHSLG
jgi:hypothetical protein